MPKYYQDTARGGWFVDPILKNHPDLTERTEAQFNARVDPVTVLTVAQLLQQLTAARKEQERQGVTVNGARYGGEPANRQALQEAVAFMSDAGLTQFPRFKDSDNAFHNNHPLADVLDAYRAIGARRVQLIAAEGQYAAQVVDGSLTEVTGLAWPQ